VAAAEKKKKEEKPLFRGRGVLEKKDKKQHALTAAAAVSYTKVLGEGQSRKGRGEVLRWIKSGLNAVLILSRKWMCAARQ
jgi:hypothetical protein